MRRTRLPRLLFAGLLALTLASSAAALQGWAFAGAASSSPGPQAAGVSIVRNVAWLGYPADSPHEFRINSLSVGAPVADAFQLNYSGGSFTLDYERSVGGPVSTSFMVTLDGLVEWTDLNGDGIPNDNNTVQWTPLGSTAFGNVPIVHEQSTAPGNTLVHTFLITSNAGDVQLSLTIAQGLVTLPSGQVLTPMEAKLTLSITHDLIRPADRLAAQVSLRTDDNVEMENQSWDDINHFSKDDRSVNVTGGLPGNASSAFFAWSNAASVNNVTGSVVASLASNETSGGQDLYLTYPRPTPGMLGYPSHLVVVHDPALGVVSAAYESLINEPAPPHLQPDIALYVISAAVVAGIVGLTALEIRRRRP